MTMSPKTCMPYGIWHMGIMAVARTYALALGLRPLGLYQFQKKQNTQTFNEIPIGPKPRPRPSHLVSGQGPKSLKCQRL